MIQRLLGGVSFVDDARNPGRGSDAADARRLRLRAATQGLPARLPAFGSSTAAQRQRRSSRTVRAYRKVIRVQDAEHFGGFFNAVAGLADGR